MGNRATAQVHPTVAPPAPGAALQSVPEGPPALPKINPPAPGEPTQQPAWLEHPNASPLFNPGDGVWNHGEEASAAGTDHGGIIDWVLHPAVLDGSGGPPSVFRYEPTSGAPEGWVAQTYHGHSFVRLRGYLGPRSTWANVPPTGRVADAAFDAPGPPSTSTPARRRSSPSCRRRARRLRSRSCRRSCMPSTREPVRSPRRP